MKRKSDLLQSVQQLLTGLDATLAREMQSYGLHNFRLVPRQPKQQLLPVMLDLELGRGRVVKRLRVTLGASMCVSQLELPLQPAKKTPTSVPVLLPLVKRQNGTYR